MECTLSLSSRWDRTVEVVAACAFTAISVCAVPTWATRSRTSSISRRMRTWAAARLALDTPTSLMASRVRCSSSRPWAYAWFALCAAVRWASKACVAPFTSAPAWRIAVAESRCCAASTFTWAPVSRYSACSTPSWARTSFRRSACSAVSAPASFEAVPSSLSSALAAATAWPSCSCCWRTPARLAAAACSAACACSRACCFSFRARAAALVLAWAFSASAA